MTTLSHSALHDIYREIYSGILEEGERTDIINPEYVECLYDLALIRGAKRIAELGVMNGMSTVAFLLAGGSVLSIDIELRETAREAIRRLGLGGAWRPVEGDSIEYGRSLGGDEKFDLIYIDSNHTYEHCRGEIEVWYPHLNQGGVMAFHDISAGQGEEVFKAISEFVSSHPEVKFSPYKQDIGIIFTGEVRIELYPGCHCGSHLFGVVGFMVEDKSTQYGCDKCGDVVSLTSGYRRKELI